MVKSWIPSRQKPKNDSTAASSSATTSRVGIRALTTRGFGSNWLSTFRQALLRRRKAPAITAAQVSEEDPTEEATTQPALTFSGTRTAKQPIAPKPPSENEDSEDSEDELVEAVSTTKTSKKKKKKRSSFGINRWVPKLLNPVEKPRDRIHRRKKRIVVDGPTTPPRLFTDPRTLHKILLAKVFAFLEPLEPAQVTAYVNKTTAAAVRSFYELYCPPPRPRRYLVNRVLENRLSIFPKKVMELLSIRDRVRASGVCYSLYDASHELPLEFDGLNTTQKFLECHGFPRTGRFHKRYGKTPALLFGGATAKQVVNTVQLLEREGDEDEGDDIECFASVREISLRQVSGFGAAKGRYFQQLLQTLIMDHVNGRLHSLELIDLKLEDAQFKDLAKFWRAVQFPALRRLSFAKNAFSSRFVRDWSWSFENERFIHLEAVDVSDTQLTNEDLQRFIECLSTTPKLTSLAISNNLCSYATIHKLRELFESRSLGCLVELTCTAITSDPVATGHLLEVFQTFPPCCPNLQIVDVSGNPLNDPKAASQLSRVFTAGPQQTSGWPELTSLNISSMQIGDDGFQNIATSILQGATSLIQHLDVSDNDICSSMDIFARALAAKRLRHLRSLVFADNKLGALEFASLSSALNLGCCPRLDTLDLSANVARGEGIARFCPFLASPPARNIWSLDLSKNEIPNQALHRLKETLALGNCVQLHELNFSCNPGLQAIVPFLDLIRGHGLPSLSILQVGYAQTRDQGRELVQETLRRRSVQELVQLCLRQLKQLRFETRLKAKEIAGDAKAAQDQIRCRKQTQHLREIYDHLENEADRALRRRKLQKKSPQLHIHQEIARQKQARAHSRLCKQLESQAA